MDNPTPGIKIVVTPVRLVCDYQLILQGSKKKNVSGVLDMAFVMPGTPNLDRLEERIKSAVIQFVKAETKTIRGKTHTQTKPKRNNSHDSH